jgi:hypothetical protein
LLLLPIEPDANKSLGGVLLEQPSATHAKLPKISTPTSSYDLSWTAVNPHADRSKCITIMQKTHKLELRSKS